MLSKIILLPLAKRIARMLWGDFLSANVLNTLLAQIEDKFNISNSLMTGEKKLEAVLEVLRKLQEVSKSGAKEEDLRAVVQFFYKILKLIRKVT